MIKLKVRNKIRDKMIESNFTFINPTDRDFDLIQNEIDNAEYFYMEFDNDQYIPPNLEA